MVLDILYEDEQDSGSLLPEETGSYQSYSLPSESSVALVDDFNAGGAAAFSQVYQLLYPAVNYFARRFGSEDLAADITADAFAKVWKMEKNFPSMQSIKTFLQVSVKNAWSNHFRHEKVKLKHQQDMLYSLPLVEGGDSALIETELLGLVYSAIEQLPVQRRKIFILAFIGQLKEKAIARQLGISIHTVHAHKTAALKQLRLSLSHLMVFLTLIMRIFPLS